MIDLYGGECPHCGQHEIVQAIKIVMLHLCDDEFLDYCQGAALLEEEGEGVFEAVVGLQRFADELEHHMRQNGLERGLNNCTTTARLGDHSAGED